MRKYLSIFCASLLVFASTNLIAQGRLSEPQRRELSVFGMRAMGLKVGASDIKETPNLADMTKLVATGLNLNGFLCASVIDISPMKVKGGYEVTCIANRGGKASKSYVLDANTGRANSF